MLKFPNLDYLNDIVVSRAIREEHKPGLEMVLDSLKAEHQRLNPDKCKLKVSELSFLGHKGNATGIHTTSD